MASKILLSLSDSDDSESEVQIASAIEGLVNGSTDPAKAAEDIDKIIWEECQAPDSTTLGWQKYLWDCLGKAAMAVPFDHPGQDHLISLLEAAQRLPHHDSSDKAVDGVERKDLWILTPRNNFRGLEQWLWELDQAKFTATQQIESSQDVATSYSNFSAFLARLLAKGIAEATRLSALVRPSPFGVISPLSRSQYSDVSEAAKHYEPWAVAAAQWILHAGDALFELCDKETVIEIGKQKWTPPLWDSWKNKFETISGSEEFSTQGRSVASGALARMLEVEKRGVTTNLVDKFGFMSMKE